MAKGGISPWVTVGKVLERGRGPISSNKAPLGVKNNFKGLGKIQGCGGIPQEE